MDDKFKKPKRSNYIKMSKEEPLKRLEEEFEKLRKEYGFKATLDELDEIFFIRDYIQREGFISKKLSRQICSRITSTYTSWFSLLHELLIPNPHNWVRMSEANLFNDEEKKKITHALKIVTEISARNTLIGLTKNKEEEARFIDEALETWHNELKPILIWIIEKIDNYWKNEIKNKEVKK